MNISNSETDTMILLKLNFGNIKFNKKPAIGNRKAIPMIRLIKLSVFFLYIKATAPINTKVAIVIPCHT